MDELAASSNPPGGHQTERHDLQRLQDDLVVQFPHVPAAAIAEHVQQAAAQFSEAPIRDYIPVLVARNVHAALRNDAAPAPEPA